MASDVSGVFSKSEKSASDEVPVKELRNQMTDYNLKIVWRNVVIFLYIHIAALYGVYLMYSQPKFSTLVWVFMLGFFDCIGVTAGAHRLWCHRSYKAKWPMRFILMIFQTIAFQNHIYEWARDHRVHHKFTDTDADPHNSRRGFFFSHIGWLLVRKHPDVLIKGATVDCSDLERDPLVVFQRKWYLYLVALCCFIIPITIFNRACGETLWYAWHINMFRYCAELNSTWLVNSAAHKWGEKPFDKSISPTENPTVSFLTSGEGWHNYHHVFPWDYKAAELGNYRLNTTTAFIDFCAYLGLAYDLRTVSADQIRKHALRSGDIN